MIRGCLLVAALFVTSSYADLPSLTYTYTMPYQGGGKLTIYNNTNQAIVIKNIRFTSNITDIGALWGNLFNGATLAKSQVGETVMSYTITEPTAGVSLPANSQSDMSFSATQFLGPLALDAGITTVAVNGEKVTLNDACIGTNCQDPVPNKRVLGYYTDWSMYQNFSVNNINFNKLNTIAYAFLIFDQDGKVQLYDPWSDAQNMPTIINWHRKFPYSHFSLSLGGWSWASTPSGWSCTVGASPAGPPACFSAMAANPTAVKNFVTNAVNAMTEVGADGIDIDWEYPTTADATNYVNLLASLRQALDQKSGQDGVHYYLTIAAPSGVDKIAYLSPEQWAGVAKAVDYIDVMTYDFHGAWDPYSDFHAPMARDPNLDPYQGAAAKYNIVDALAAYHDLGIPNAKLVIGLPLYGRMVTITPKNLALKGLYQPITGTPLGEFDKSPYPNTGMFNYNCIVDHAACPSGSNPPPSDLVLVNPATDPLGQDAQTPWGYSANYFMSYDDYQSAITKANYIQQNGYAGVMYWELSGDFPATDNRSILSHVADILH